MAFSKAPVVSTYHTDTLPLMEVWNNRLQSNFDGSQDSQQTVAQNVYFEVVQDAVGSPYYNVIKRDGYTQEFVSPDGAAVLGIYYWKQVDRLVLVTSAHIYQLNVTTGATSTIAGTGSFSSANSQFFGVNFTEFLFEDGHVDLIISSDGAIGGLNVAGVWNPVAAPPVTQWNAYPVFLDGYLFIAGYDGNLYNSNLNDPYTWVAANFISVESYPDYTQAIARVGNYIVALGTGSCEWFYDAANPTGTPLARADGATQEVGFLMGLVNTENAIYFVGKSDRGAAGVYTIKGLKLTEVSTPTVRRWLGLFSTAKNSRGHLINMGGHRFYCVTQNRDNLSPIQTYMMDLDNNMWTRLVLRQDTGGPFIFSSTTVFQSNITSKYAQSLTFFSEFGTNRVSAFRPEAFNDASGTVNFTCRFVTYPQDLGNYRYKFVSRYLFGTDQTPSTSLMSVSWSDDDMQTYSTPRTVDLSKVYEPLYAGGAFRKRSIQITYTDNFHMRWRNIEIDYNQGDA